MAQPTYYSEGTQELPTDTRLKLWTKILGHFQNLPGADPRDNPTQTDTFRTIQVKLLRSVKNTVP